MPRELFEPKGPKIFRLNRAPGVPERNRSGQVLRQLNLKAIGSKLDLLQSVSKTLDFPDHFGENWDALADCLTDLSWLPFEQLALVLEEYRPFEKSNPVDFSVFLEIFETAAEFWSENSRGFVLILVDPPAASDSVEFAPSTI